MVREFLSRVLNRGEGMAVIEVGTDLFESALYVIFLDLFNMRRIKGRKADVCSFVCFLLLYVNILVSEIETFYSYSPIIVDLVISICYTRLFLQGKIWSQLGSILLYQIGLVGAAVIVIGGVAFGEDNGILLWMYVGALERTLIVIGSDSLLLFYVIFLIRQQKRVEAKRSKEAFLALFLVPIVIIGLVIILLKFLVEVYYVNERGRMTVGIMAGIVILLAVIIYLYFKGVQKEKEKEYAYALVAEQKRSYQDLLRQQDDIRMLEHDMKNRLLGIRSYFVSGKIDKGLERIDELLEAYGGNYAGWEGGRCPWQTVIEVKMVSAREQGITVESKVEKNDYSEVDDIDFCIILGNLLDNAIESQARVRDKHISLYVAKDKGITYVRLENSVPERADIRLLGTSKKDFVRHGFGIRSVKKVIKKYGGTIDFEIEVGKIVATVLLQLTP